MELRIESISSAFERKAESAFSVDMLRTSLISCTLFLERFVLCIDKENRLCYSFVIKMQLKIIDLRKKKYSTERKTHCSWFQVEAENKSQSVGCCGTATFLAGSRLFIDAFINILMVIAVFCREVGGKSGLNVRKKVCWNCI